MPNNASPWWRLAAVSERVAAGASPPEDPHEAALYALLRGQRAPDETVETAYWIFKSSYKHAMDALVLCSTPDKEVEHNLELAPGVYEVYKKLFFDRSVFDSVFAMRGYVSGLTLTDEEAAIYQLALQEGPQRLMDRYRVGPRKAPDPQTVLEDMLGEAHSRAFEHRGRAITSRVATESFKWGRAAASTALAMKQAASSGRLASALEQLEFALTSDDQTKTPEDLGLKHDDIVKG